MKGYRFYRREWLNKPGNFTVAHILATVDEDKGTNAGVELHIADCNRSIALSLPMYTKEDRRNTLHKLNTLIWTLSEFEDAVKEVCNEASQQRRS